MDCLAPSRLGLLGIADIWMALVFVLVALLIGCSPCERDGGCVLTEGLSAGLLSVRAGAVPSEMWVVGASPSDGTGPLVLHLSDDSWRRLDTSTWAGSELWWVWEDGDEAVFVGNDGLILQMSGESIDRVSGPDAQTTFFGVWGASAADLWAVGMTLGGSGTPALWRRQDGAWAAWVDPDLGPGELGETWFKVHGAAADDVWIVGSDGASLHFDGQRLTRVSTTSDVDTSNAPLVSVDAGGVVPIAVGGAGNGVLLEFNGSDWRDHSPDFQPGWNGVCTGADAAWAVGQAGVRATRTEEGWMSDAERSVRPVTTQDWHSCALDADGGLWTVGGRIASRPLIDGVMAYQGPGDPPALDLL